MNDVRRFSKIVCCEGPHVHGPRVLLRGQHYLCMADPPSVTFSVERSVCVSVISQKWSYILNVLSHSNLKLISVNKCIREIQQRKHNSKQKWKMNLHGSQHHLSTLMGMLRFQVRNQSVNQPKIIVHQSMTYPGWIATFSIWNMFSKTKITWYTSEFKQDFNLAAWLNLRNVLAPTLCLT